MTNPNNAIGTNGAFDGRTSPNALNDLAAAYSKGIVSGWLCSPKSGMTVQLGGSASVRDVALAEDNAGDKLTIDNRSGAPVEITLGAAPSTNNRVDAIVAYVDNPSVGDGTTTDNPTACGIIAVPGTVAANPTAPNDTQIRAAITTDGATGGVAYYVVLATILVGTNVTTIGSGVITQGAAAQSLAPANIPDGGIVTTKLANGAVTPIKTNTNTNGAVDEQVIDTADGLRIMIFRKDISVNYSSSPASNDVEVTLPAAFADANYLLIQQTESPANSQGYYIGATYGVTTKTTTSYKTTLLRGASTTAQNAKTKLNVIAIGRKP